MDNDGWTPLHFAAWEGQEACLRALVELGASVACVDKDS